jgi:hypothetical protein
VCDEASVTPHDHLTITIRTPFAAGALAATASAGVPRTIHTPPAIPRSRSFKEGPAARMLSCTPFLVFRRHTSFVCTKRSTGSVADGLSPSPLLYPFSLLTGPRNVAGSQRSARQTQRARFRRSRQDALSPRLHPSLPRQPCLVAPNAFLTSCTPNQWHFGAAALHAFVDRRRHSIHIIRTTGVHLELSFRTFDIGFLKQIARCIRHAQIGSFFIVLSFYEVYI